jgi:hypothetical protein
MRANADHVDQTKRLNEVAIELAHRACRKWSRAPLSRNHKLRSFAPPTVPWLEPLAAKTRHEHRSIFRFGETIDPQSLPSFTDWPRAKGKLAAEPGDDVDEFKRL